MNELKDDNYYMQIALEEAKKAGDLGEVPIGAIIVYNGQIIGRASNLRETTQNAVTHAELMAIQQACDAIGSWRLEETTLYVTLEPCPMCAGAIVQSRIPRVVYGARDPKAGCVDSLYRLLNDERFNHMCEVTEGIMAEQCGAILSDFFRQLRIRKKEEKRIRQQQILQQDDIK